MNLPSRYSSDTTSSQDGAIVVVIIVPDDRRPPRDIYPTPDEIAVRAYEMLRERSSRAFGAGDYWSAAETELLERAATRALQEVDRRKRRRKDG